MFSDAQASTLWNTLRPILRLRKDLTMEWMGSEDPTGQPNGIDHGGNSEGSDTPSWEPKSQGILLNNRKILVPIHSKYQIYNNNNNSAIIITSY